MKEIMRQPQRRVRGGPSAVEELAVPQGAELFGADQAPRGLYLLRSGHVRLLGVDEVILDNLSPGSVFGEKALLAHPVLKRQTALAVSAAKITLFRKAGLKQHMRDDSYFATRMIRGLGLRLDSYEQVIRDFVKEGAGRRLAYLLLRLAASGHGWVKIPFPLTNPDLSNMVGTSRWRISNLLNQFQKRGLLRRQPDIWIQREALRKYLKKHQ
jgi:CRP-like cAMP-binding protein